MIEREMIFNKIQYRKRGINMFTLIALLLFAIGLYNIYEHQKTLENCYKVQGVLVDLHYTPPMNGHRSTLYPVFEYTINGVKYREEYRYQAIDGLKFSEMAGDKELVDEKIKEFLKKSAEKQPDFKIGQTYNLQVKRDNHKVFFIENQWAVMQEAKWFIMGGVVLILNFLFEFIVAFFRH